MGKSLLKLLGVVAASMLSATVSAVGMGGINVAGALGQPLKAEIELVAISKAEKDSLVARLASPEAYKSAGLEYPYGNKFKFQIESRADGQQYIKVSSVQPVNDPFVSLLVELTWSSGKLSREYTFLLDPPGYVPEQPAQVKVEAVAPQVQAPASAVVAPETKTATRVEQAVPATAVTPAEQVMPTESAANAAEQAALTEMPAKLEEQAATTEIPVKLEEQAVPVPEESATISAEQAALEAAAVQANNEWIEVQRGDTMTKIAEQYKQSDISLERMLVAMYRINAEQFDGRNMNRIRVGKILHLPSQQEMMRVSQPDAEKEIHAQAANWNAYRQKLASAATVSNQSQSVQSVQQVATGKISSSIADMAPVAKESAREVLKLSKGEAPGEQIGAGAGGKSMSEQDKKNAEQEDAIAKNKALKEGQERIALLEKNLKDMQRLAQLKAEAASAQAQPQEAAKTVVSQVTATSVVKPIPVVQPKPPVQEKRDQVKPEQGKPEPSLLDQVQVEPLYLAGGAAAMLVLGGLGFMLSRRKKKLSYEDIGDITGHMAAPVQPSPDTGDYTAMAGVQGGQAPQSESVDPISEADLFLNFGRDVQAEEILKEALQNTPNNHQIHLKLLGIYANRKDTNSFSTIASQLKDSGDDDAWQQAIAMGHKLEPNNPIYGGKSMEDTTRATIKGVAFNDKPEPEHVPKTQGSALDFDFDVNASATNEIPSAAGGAEMDFDVSSTLISTPMASGTGGGDMDFDVTTANTSMGEAGVTTQDADDLVFDVPGSHSFKPAEAQPEIIKPEEADSGGMAFTLDFPVEAEKPASVAQSAAIGLEGINLNFDDATAPSGSSESSEPAAGGSDQWQEVATKLDLAKAYQEMGDADGAREILNEVLREGDEEQQATAKTLFAQLG